MGEPAANVTLFRAALDATAGTDNASRLARASLFAIAQGVPELEATLAEVDTFTPRLRVFGQPCATGDDVVWTLAWMLRTAASPTLILRAIREYIAFDTAGCVACSSEAV